MRKTVLSPHFREHGAVKQFIVDGAPFIMLAGEIHNSSSASMTYMTPLWDKLAALHLNTVIAPLYWELIELEEGVFDFALLDGLIAGAREHNMRLVLLWFASWKNAASSYVPAWVKTDLARFPRMQCQPGEDANALTCFSVEARQADAAAFAAVMRHIRQVDEGFHTVLAMQVENETGVLNTSRDRCDLAEAAFQQPVPKSLTAYLRAHQEDLVPSFRELWEAQGTQMEGTWEEVFGEWADEVFMAWHIGSYVDIVAAAGKAGYNIPMVANAWLKLGLEQPPGKYPSGGPVYTMLDVWKAVALHIDVLAPDIYAADFRAVCAAYARSDNPLFIPEATRDARAASAVFYALGQHDAVCYAPFGIDGVSLPHPLGDSYALLQEMMPLLVQYQGQGRMVGFFQQMELETWVLELDGYQIRVTTTQPIEPDVPPAGGLILALGEAEFLVVGRGVKVEFMRGVESVAEARPNVEFLWLEAGTIKAGKWVMERRLNGDETAHGRAAYLRRSLTACKLKLNTAVVPVHHQDPRL